MKKKLISLLQRKRHIVALSTILMTFIVMSCLFIDSVDITQMIDGKAVNYAKAGTTATFKMHGHIKVQGDPRNDKRLVFGFLAPKSWNLAQNARVSYTEDTFDPNIGEQNMTLIPLTEQPSNKPGLSWSAALMQEYGVGTNILEDMEWAAYWTRPYNGVADEIHFTIYVRVPVGNKNLRFKPSFFINSTDDNFSTSADAKKCEEAGCFEVVEGEGLAQAVMEKPQVLILDEPMNGLDKKSVKKVEDILKAFVENGGTLLMTSHIEQQVEACCKIVYEIDGGEILRVTD